MVAFGILGSGRKKAGKIVSAKEAVEQARDAIVERVPEDAAVAKVCCIYTSSLDSNIDIQTDGRCQAWHIDFYSPASGKVYLVRVAKGKTYIRERLWSETERKPVEYVFAIYGKTLTGSEQAEPIMARDNWVDSPDVAVQVDEWVQGQISRSEQEGEMYGLMCLCLPARCLRYLYNEKARNKLHIPYPPSEPAWAGLYTPMDIEDKDSFLLYLSAEGGKVLQYARFRFPPFFNYGTSGDW